VYILLGEFVSVFISKDFRIFGIISENARNGKIVFCEILMLVHIGFAKQQFHQFLGKNINDKCLQIMHSETFFDQSRANKVRNSEHYIRRTSRLVWMKSWRLRWAMHMAEIGETSGTT
jgi:hypothetical protein